MHTKVTSDSSLELRVENLRVDYSLPGRIFQTQKEMRRGKFYRGALWSYSSFQPGAFSGEATPVPIPNTEVKLTSGDDTAYAGK